MCLYQVPLLFHSYFDLHTCCASVCADRFSTVLMMCVQKAQKVSSRGTVAHRARASHHKSEDPGSSPTQSHFPVLPHLSLHISCDILLTYLIKGNKSPQKCLFKKKKPEGHKVWPAVCLVGARSLTRTPSTAVPR